MGRRTISFPEKIDKRLSNRKEKTGESISSQVKKAVAKDLEVIE